MQKVLLDTSVVTPALLIPHSRHEDAVGYLRRAEAGDIALMVSTHCLAETFSNLTIVPVIPRLTPEIAQQMLNESLLPYVETVELHQDDYELAIARVARLGLTSGAIYDALHVRAAEKSGCDELVTFNGRDFRRMPPDPPTRLVVL